MVLFSGLSWSLEAHGKVERASNWRQMPWVSVISGAGSPLEGGGGGQAGRGGALSGPILMSGAQNRSSSPMVKGMKCKTEIGGETQSNRLEEDSDLMGTSLPKLTLGAQDSKWCQIPLLRASHVHPRCTLLDREGRRCKGLQHVQLEKPVADKVWEEGPHSRISLSLPHKLLCQSLHLVRY